MVRASTVDAFEFIPFDDRIVRAVPELTMRQLSRVRLLRNGEPLVRPAGYELDPDAGERPVWAWRGAAPGAEAASPFLPKVSCRAKSERFGPRYYPEEPVCGVCQGRANCLLLMVAAFDKSNLLQNQSLDGPVPAADWRCYRHCVGRSKPMG